MLRPNKYAKSRRELNLASNPGTEEGERAPGIHCFLMRLIVEREVRQLIVQCGGRI